MSADVLRRAASLMRERARDACDVRESLDLFIVTAWCDLAGSSYAIKSSGGTLSHGSCEEEALYFASWPPAVALAVADWLDATADDVGAWRQPDYAALTVARGYLAESAAEPTDAQLDREMGLTGWEHSCRHLLDPERCCRRQAGHSGQCACGFGAGRVRFDSEVTT